MTFARLRAADWVAFLAALALLFVTAADWYSTKGGEQAREFEQGAPARGEGAELADDAAGAAEEEERNAWQADAAIDRVILTGLLGTAALAIFAAFTRAAGRRYESGLSPTAWAGLAAALRGCASISAPGGGWARGGSKLMVGDRRGRDRGEVPDARGAARRAGDAPVGGGGSERVWSGRDLRGLAGDRDRSLDDPPRSRGA